MVRQAQVRFREKGNAPPLKGLQTACFLGIGSRGCSEESEMLLGGRQPEKGPPLILKGNVTALGSSQATPVTLNS